MTTAAMTTPTLGRIERIVMCLVAVALTCGSLVHKLGCVFPAPTVTQLARTACYSDVSSLFGSRHIAEHVFPYLQPLGGGGTVEYPTLTGIWVWLSALPVSSAHGFVIATALTFVPVVVATTLSLQRVAGRRAWFWAAAPALFLYALYNWDLLPVLMTTLGLLVALAGPRSWSPTTRTVLAGAAFGLGGAFKLYPLLFVAPLVLAAIIDRDSVHRWRRAIGTVGSAVGVVAAANLPFVLADFDAWASVFRYQGGRSIDASTLSVWYWGLLPWSDEKTGHVQHLMGLAATGTTALGIVAVLTIGAVIGIRTGVVPWVQTAAALLAVYMLCNKVDSLQYALWLLPFFVVLRIRVGWIVAYFAADLIAFVGWFRWIYYQSLGNLATTWANQALGVGVWGRAALLFALCFVFLRSELATPWSGRDRVDPVPTRRSAAVRSDEYPGAVGAAGPTA